MKIFFEMESCAADEFFHLSRHRARWLMVSFVAAVFIVCASVGSVFYYRSVYASLEQKKSTLASYEKERKEVLAKVAMLESSVRDAQALTGNLAALVGSQRVDLGKGIGPLPSADANRFDIQKKTAPIDLESLASIEALDPRINNVGQQVDTLRAKVKELTKIQNDKLLYIASTPSLWPVKGWVTSDFGFRRSPFTLKSDFHGGIDIAAAWGTPVMAPADGVVTFSGQKGGYGNSVVIDHGFGIVTKYGHASQLLVTEGQKIKRGTRIALVGNTGHSTGPHLHYEIHADGVPVDPMKYILR